LIISYSFLGEFIK